jgi:hypothetical protein
MLRNVRAALLPVILTGAWSCGPARAGEPPVIPVGLEAYPRTISSRHQAPQRWSSWAGMRTTGLSGRIQRDGLSTKSIGPIARPNSST